MSSFLDHLLVLLSLRVADRLNSVPHYSRQSYIKKILKEAYISIIHNIFQYCPELYPLTGNFFDQVLKCELM